MRVGFRWYGPDDPVGLDAIRQVPGVEEVVTALHEVPAGEPWTSAQASRRRDEVESAGLKWSVVESIPVAEAIKLGSAEVGHALDAWCRSLEAAAGVGVKVICYNFMPVFDWLRTDLSFPMDDGSSTLAFRQSDLAQYDLAAGFAGLPAWAENYTAQGLAELLLAYRAVDASRLWDAFAAFLEHVLPVAETLGVRLAVHPDDPPWSVFGLPRIVTGADSWRRLRQISSSPANGFTFCTGSLGSRADNDLGAIIDEFAPHIHFVHARNVRRSGVDAFVETAHPEGDLNLADLIRRLSDAGFVGVVRPDHGRMIWGEGGRPGYGLYDRALGATYLKGILDAL